MTQQEFAAALSIFFDTFPFIESFYSNRHGEKSPMRELLRTLNPEVDTHNDSGKCLNRIWHAWHEHEYETILDAIDRFESDPHRNSAEQQNYYVEVSNWANMISWEAKRWTKPPDDWRTLPTPEYREQIRAAIIEAAQLMGKDVQEWGDVERHVSGLERQRGLK